MTHALHIYLKNRRYTPTRLPSGTSAQLEAQLGLAVAAAGRVLVVVGPAVRRAARAPLPRALPLALPRGLALRLVARVRLVLACRRINSVGIL